MGPSQNAGRSVTAVRVRLLGGSLNGQVLWVEKGQEFLDVNIAVVPGTTKRLRYHIDGHVGSLVSESNGEAGTGPVKP